MDKRYQVFISSTFQDLQGARQEVSQALLRADCFPAGMELFPAADEEQFEFIKTVIDQSDYYIIISAGRYGSIHPGTGLSYTEMEYDYAVEIGKPVIRLLHKDPKSIADEGDEKLAKLLTFRVKMSESRMVAFWESADQLGKEATYALLEIKKSKSAIGWVKADGKASSAAELEIEKLRRKVAELELQVSHRNFNLEKSLSSFGEDVSLKFNHLGDEVTRLRGNKEEVLAQDEFSISSTELAETFCIAILSNSMEARIKESVEAYIAAKCNARGRYSVIWSSRFDFRKFLRKLEAEQIIYSQVYERNYDDQFSELRWQIEEDARSAVAKLEIERTKTSF